MNNLFLSHKYHSTTNNVVQSIPPTATDNVVKFRVDPSQAIKVAKSLGKDITESYSKNEKIKNNGKKLKTLTPVERQINRNKERNYLFGLKKTASEILPTERVSYCHNCRADFQKNVFIKVNQTVSSGTKAKFGNVFVCDDIWRCPVCSKKISFERGKEIQKAVAIHHDKNRKAVSMLTLTIPHYRGDDLAWLLKKLAEAKKRLFGDRLMRKVYEQFRLLGHITNTEFTYGSQNGWHPHHHILMFADYDLKDFASEQVAVIPVFDENGVMSYQYVDNKKERALAKQKKDHLIELVSFEHFMKIQWQKFCLAVGLSSPSYEHGLTLQGAENASEYLSKFQTAMELTASMNKQAKQKNRNQWEILHDANLGDARSKALFFEYAKATKGKRQLAWTKGLKDKFGIDDLTDEEVNELEEVKEEEIISQKFIDIDWNHWLVILRNNLQPLLLNLTEDRGGDFVANYINQNFGKGRTIVVDSYESLRQYDKNGYELKPPS